MCRLDAGGLSWRVNGETEARRTKAGPVGTLCGGAAPNYTQNRQTCFRTSLGYGVRPASPSMLTGQAERWPQLTGL